MGKKNKNNNNNNKSVNMDKSRQTNAAGAPKRTSKLQDALRLIPRGTFAAAGGALGGPAGAAIGTALSTITGYGSYRVDGNSLLDKTVYGHEAQNIPTFAPSEHGSRVRHREFVTNVVSSGAGFNSLSWNLSAANTDLFPWLSRLATRYQKYKVHGMVFYYKSTSTDYNNSGTVALAVNYDVSQVAFVTMDQMLNSMFAVAAKPSESFAAPVECDPSTMPRGGYLVQQPAAQGGVIDDRFSSVGKLNLATEGLSLPAGTVLGQLWCTYDVELLYPYISPADSGINHRYGFVGRLGSTGNVPSGGLPAGYSSFGPFVVVLDANGGLTVTWSGLTQEYIGSWKLNISKMSYASARINSSVAPTPSSVSGCTLVTNEYAPPALTGASVNYTHVAASVTINNTSGSVFVPQYLVTGPTSGDVNYQMTLFKVV